MPGNQLNNILLIDKSTGKLRSIKEDDSLQISSNIELVNNSSLKIEGLSSNKILSTNSDGYLAISNNISIDNGNVAFVSGSASNADGYFSFVNNDVECLRITNSNTSDNENIKFIFGSDTNPDGYVSFINNQTECLRIINSQTNSISFGIGGIDGNLPTITSGVGIPSISVNNGSIYLRTDGYSDSVLYTYQNNSWIAVGSSSQQNHNSYRQSFTSTNIIDNILSIEHNLNNKYVNVSVYDNDDYMIFPSRIKAFSQSIVKIDLSNFDIVGTWNVVVLA